MTTCYRQGPSHAHRPPEAKLTALLDRRSTGGLVPGGNVLKSYSPADVPRGVQRGEAHARRRARQRDADTRARLYRHRALQASQAHPARRLCAVKPLPSAPRPGRRRGPSRCPRYPAAAATTSKRPGRPSHPGFVRKFSSCEQPTCRPAPCSTDHGQIVDQVRYCAARVVTRGGLCPCGNMANMAGRILTCRTCHHACLIATGDGEGVQLNTHAHPRTVGP
jgi:hypothetical protein